MEFMGYVRPDGKVGARNYVAVIPSVTCANDVANAICHQVPCTWWQMALATSLATPSATRYRVPLHICTIRAAARCPLIWSA